jgi:hypothetical protein
MPNWRRFSGAPSNLPGLLRHAPSRTVYERDEDSGVIIRYDVVLVNLLEADNVDMKSPAVANLPKFIREGHYCGYAMFPRCPLARPERATYNVDAHRGITFNTIYPGGAYRFGFDCGHVGDEDREELRNLDYLEELCRSMGQQIWVYASIEHVLLYSIAEDEVAAARATLDADRDVGDAREKKVLSNIKK